ncbi:cupin domain-containing protein [Cryobacterium sp. N21]|uniref:cupin domain-containing protein n=1 Tax=Cryobacterium sp. N21 TaxID=2048289 RepID=UPI000CE53F83|nr:cupin domain-containing protein [Cryobacterium sp. N21]
MTNTTEPSPRTRFVYDEWIESVGVPIHTGFYISDLRTIELGWWEERGCQTGFVQLEGQEGVSETRITEIPPGETLPSYSIGLDEVVYVLKGNGATLVEDGDGHSDSFEWNTRSMFLVPAHANRRFRNLSGESVRLIHYTYLPLALSVVTDPDFFLKNPYRPAGDNGSDKPTAFGDAANIAGGEGYRWINGQRGKGVAYWYGRFYPDMSAWDRLDSNSERGAGSKTVRIQFAGTDMSAHMSVFAPQTYKKGHRHGPGRAILIPKGEGYSLMWKEGEEKVVVRWQEGSMFVPPNRWFHQHFNVGLEPARYLAIHPPIQLNGYTEKVVNANDQVEYVNEDPSIRAMFEEDLAQRNLTSLMPDEAYTDPSFSWS